VTPPSSRELARAWFDVGTQSIGGGSSTLYMIRRLLVERHGWISPREFTESWSLSQLSPGIHIVAFAGLLGRRIAGTRGVVMSVVGMMLPAALITAVITAAFGGIAEHPLTRAALAGIGPVAGGMTIGLALSLGRPAVRRHASGVADALLAVASCAVLLVGIATTIVVIAVAAAIGALFLGRGRPTSADAPLA
jgi:chromate transporter